jgi:hypothetical protein
MTPIASQHTHQDAEMALGFPEQEQLLLEPNSYSQLAAEMPAPALGLNFDPLADPYQMQFEDHLLFPEEAALDPAQNLAEELISHPEPITHLPQEAAAQPGGASRSR